MATTSRPKVTASIIMVTCNAHHHTKLKLVELCRTMSEDSELVWIDNASSDDDGNTAWWVKNFPKSLQFYRFSENTGFSHACNKGAELACGEYIIFTQNDVIAHNPKWVEEITSMIGTDDRMLVGGRVIDFHAGWNDFDHEGVRYTVPYCEGWLIAMRWDAWMELGGFDEHYSPYDMEDVDLSMNALSKGFHLTSLPPNMLEHLGGRSFHSNLILPQDRLETTKEHYQYFYEKWKNVFPTMRGVLCS